MIKQMFQFMILNHWKQKGSTLNHEENSKVRFCICWQTTLMAFYHVAYNVTKSNKPHTIAEELIKPCVLQMTKNFMGKDA